MRPPIKRHARTEPNQPFPQAAAVPCMALPLFRSRKSPWFFLFFFVSNLTNTAALRRYRECCVA